MYETNYPERRHFLRRGDITVGAGDKNDIVVDKPAVSWNHALIIAREQKLQIQDSASTNGTYVNNVEVERPRKLNHGDDVRFGNIEYKIWIKPQLRGGEHA